jgi:Transglutaminase-like superfamily
VVEKFRHKSQRMNDSQPGFARGAVMANLSSSHPSKSRGDVSDLDRRAANLGANASASRLKGPQYARLPILSIYMRCEEPRLPRKPPLWEQDHVETMPVVLMEAARHWGFGARFVTGYIQMNNGSHGTTHAWAEIDIPGSGLIPRTKCMRVERV